MLACGICPRVSSSVPSTSMPISRIMPLRQYCACDRCDTIGSRRARMRLDEFSGVNAGYVLELYDRYTKNPESVDPQTRRMFESWAPALDVSAAVKAPSQAGFDIRKVVGAAN